MGEALKASGLSREQVFVTTKCPGAIGFNATLQCTSALESLEDNMGALDKADAKVKRRDAAAVAFWPGPKAGTLNKMKENQISNAVIENSKW